MYDWNGCFKMICTYSGCTLPCRVFIYELLSNLKNLLRDPEDQNCIINFDNLLTDSEDQSSIWSEWLATKTLPYLEVYWNFGVLQTDPDSLYGQPRGFYTTLGHNKHQLCQIQLVTSHLNFSGGNSYIVLSLMIN